MAENLPVNFTIPSENVIASFSANDLITQTGVVNLLGFTAQDSTKNNIPYLGQNSLWGNVNSINASTTVSISTLPFVKPFKIRGQSILQLNTVAHRSGQAGSAGTIYITAVLKIIRANSSVVTLDTVEHDIVTGLDNGGYAGNITVLSFTIPETTINIGDRIVLDFTGGGSFYSGYVYVYCDPTDTAITSPVSLAHTILNISIPFDIEL